MSEPKCNAVNPESPKYKCEEPPNHAGTEHRAYESFPGDFGWVTWPSGEKRTEIADLNNNWLEREFHTFQRLLADLWSSCETTRSEEIHKIASEHGLALHAEMVKRGLR